jgi:hypothetical protein
VRRKRAEKRSFSASPMRHDQHNRSSYPLSSAFRLQRTQPRFYLRDTLCLFQMQTDKHQSNIVTKLRFETLEALRMVNCRLACVRSTMAVIM